MATKKIGMAFSREFIGKDPLAHIGVKNPVYNWFLELCTKRGWDTYILTRKTYKGAGIFEGSWKFKVPNFLRKGMKVPYGLTGAILRLWLGINGLHTRQLAAICLKRS